MLAGYPGAALLYAIAAALFRRRQPREEAAAAGAGVMGQCSRMLWLALWIGAASFTALPQTGEGGLPLVLTTNETEAPGPQRSLDASELRWLTVGNTTVLGIVVAVGCLAVGFTVFLRFLPRLFLSLGAVMALAGWVAMEAAGERQERAAGRRPGGQRQGRRGGQRGRDARRPAQPIPDSTGSAAMLHVMERLPGRHVLRRREHA